MHKRTAHRWRLLITMMAAVFFAAGSFWLLQLMLRDDNETRSAANRDEPDYIIDKFSFVRMSPQGEPHYLFYGDKLTHLPLNDASDVIKPIFKTIVPGKPTMTVTSQTARMFHGENKVDLLGKVEIQRPESPTTRFLRINSEALTVYPDEDRMESDQRVSMVLGTATVTGIGMQANNATGQIDFRSKGQLVVPPKAAR
ncbi:LPS export ABC transporter periplasmic protein LptC [Massilia sp. CF038]|uniref:LPS export ABC transporter periplasmic protein LptC n=1 Tax=Massilia sp. CF038 TaxID=1881045 RepID=UPI000934D057|nr:LPS export ABC transporter periplasmic protein LptC [Massilia sp. CF038]